MNFEKLEELMARSLKECNMKMLIEMTEGTLEPIIKDNIRAGSVMKFYFLLNAIPKVGKEMKKDLEIPCDDKEYWEEVVDAILKFLKAELMEE